MATWKWYGKAAESLLKGNLDFDADTFKTTLHTSTYVPDQDAHDFRNDLTDEITGTGYTAGGLTLTTPVISYDAATNEARVMWDDAEWTSATFSGVRTAVIQKIRGGASSADELVAYLDMVSDQSVSASTFKLDFTTSVLKLAVA